MTLGSTIIRDISPLGRDVLGRGETVTFESGGGEPATPTIIAVDTVRGMEAADGVGLRGERRTRMAVRNDANLVDPLRWRTAKWRNEDWKIMQPPTILEPTVVVYELVALGRVELSTGEYRNT